MSYIISQRCSPTAFSAPQSQAVSWAHNCQHNAFILSFFQEFGSALVLVVVVITHYYNFIYSENRILVKLGMVLLAFILPQERSDHKVPWLLVLNAKLTSFTLFFNLKLKFVTSTFLTGEGKDLGPACLDVVLKPWGSVSWRSGQVAACMKAECQNLSSSNCSWAASFGVRQKVCHREPVLLFRPFFFFLHI